MHASAAFASPPGLSAEEVARYRRDGFLVVDRPVLPWPRFAALRARFEELLAALPPGERPEAMDVPHFTAPDLVDYACDPAILALVEPLIGPDIALFSTHFIAKPPGDGRRVPWHEDSAYWRGQIEPMEVATVWLAIDASDRGNGGMRVIPRSHLEGARGYSDYEDVDPAANVFPSEVVKGQRDDARQLWLELGPNEASIHDARLMHGSAANTSERRRCGWTLRFCPTTARFAGAAAGDGHLVFLAKGRDRAGNRYAERGRAYPEALAARRAGGRHRHAH